MPFGPEVLTPTARPFPRHKADQRRISWVSAVNLTSSASIVRLPRQTQGHVAQNRPSSSLRRRRATSSTATTSARMRRASGTFGTIGIAPPPDRIGILCANDTFGVADSPLQGDGFEPSVPRWSNYLIILSFGLASDNFQR